MNKSTDDYFTLVHAFPIVPIRSKRQFDAADRVLAELLRIPEERLSRGQSDYLSMLGNVMADYEAEELAEELAGLTANDVLKHLMDAQAMSASDLGRVLGNRELGGKILRRERELSKRHILTLAAYFGVEPGLFLGPAGPNVAQKNHRLRRAG